MAALQSQGWFPDPNRAPAGVLSITPHEDSFYTYTGSKPLAEIAPGTVLKTRDIPYHILGVPTLLKTTQLLYRSTSQLNEPTVNVTSVIQPLGHTDKTKVISYQSAYDSLDRDDEPSNAISGGLRFGGIVSTVELVVFGSFLAEGYTVIVPDTEGQRATFAAGGEYGRNTLDSIRAAFESPTVGLARDARVALLGYSGGAIASEWAAELAPSYAPDANEHLIGAAIGGVLVHPARNLNYVQGTYFWAGVIPMALIGIARAFGINLEPYLTDKGLKLFREMENASITNVLGEPRYWRLKWTDLVVAKYPTPETLPILVEKANKLIMGTGGTPTIPMFIGQGARGELEWTPGDKPGIGRGDGVMIAGDVRTLARDYCAKGVAVEYREYDLLSHITSLPIWQLDAIDWIKDRFAGKPPQQNCSTIQPGNPIGPIPMPS
jgi:fermentation-respiration switch protein FrsA (DUF1100 family)